MYLSARRRRDRRALIARRAYFTTTTGVRAYFLTTIVIIIIGMPFLPANLRTVIWRGFFIPNDQWDRWAPRGDFMPTEYYTAEVAKKHMERLSRCHHFNFETMSLWGCQDSMEHLNFMIRLGTTYVYEIMASASCAFERALPDRHHSLLCIAFGRTVILNEVFADKKMRLKKTLRDIIYNAMTEGASKTLFRKIHGNELVIHKIIGCIVDSYE